MDLRIWDTTLYGLGKGVYPVGKAPWTRQHPAALNFIEAVFADEIAKEPSLTIRNRL